MKIIDKKNFAVGVLASLMLVLVNIVLVSGTAHAGNYPGVNGRILVTDITGPAYHFSSVKSDGTDYKSVLSDSVSKKDVEYSANGTKIVYVQSVSTVDQIFTANANGSSPQQITSSSQNTYTPSWSADGSKILYGQAVSGSVRIFRMNSDGSNQTQLTSSASYYDPQYSPDGTKIVALLDDTDDEVVTMNADGSNIVNLTNNSVNEQKASWSPNGSKLVYSSLVSGQQVIFVMNSDGSNQTQLTESGLMYSVRAPEFSPDGTRIAFVDNRAPSLIYTMNPDGTNMTEIQAGWPRDFSWQPLTIFPSATTPNPSITVSGGKASLDIASKYSDAYEGIDNSSVTITSAPTLGTASVDATSGVITYEQKKVASRNFMSTLSSIFFPKVSAAPTDSFGYRICSLSSASLCSNGTVAVNGLSTLAETGDNQQFIANSAAAMLVGATLSFILIKRRAQI